MDILNRRRLFILFSTLVLTVVGCATFKADWKPPESTSDNAIALAAPKLSNGSVAMEIEFVSINLTGLETKISQSKLQSATVNDFWHWIDETAVASDVRSELRLNGIRVGRVHTQSEFRRSLDAFRRVPEDAATKLLRDASIGSDVIQPAKKEILRLGKRHELPVRPPSVGSVATLINVGGKTIGKTLDSAQPLFAVNLVSSDASTVNIRLQPEIQFGAMKQTYVTSDSALRIANRRDHWAIPELAFDLSASENDVIVVGAIMPPFGLGQQMFTGSTADGETDHALMVLRVAEMPKVLGP